MDIRLASADFSSPVRGSGPRVVPQTLVFPRQVTNATAGITGYSIGYSPTDDHHVGKLEVKLDTSISGNTVTVTASLGLRDWSGDWDDNYQGRIDFVVLADLAPITAAPPRGDLQITGMEINQAVQFFRASSYLDSATAQPDNAIAPIARKETGIRVYVDYDATAGLPPIANLTGQLTVRTSATTLTLSPINPGGAIQPRRDAAINMAVADHTLNFDVPAVWCTGEVVFGCQVWDQAAPGSRSALFTRTVVFTTVAPLNIYTVGVGAANPAVVAAPTQTQILSSSLPQLIKTYPVGDIVITGYTSINFDDPVGGDLNSGCGSYSTVLDRLSDLRGSSGDIYLGIVADAIPQAPGNTVGGCGRSNLAATFLGQPSDVPHEIGHALGRRHAPCTAGRCSIPPANVDSNYPQYASFPSDSIGVFGFDPTSGANAVFPPASTFDFMAYSFPQWVSAYTYAGIGGAFPSVGGPGAGGLASAHQRPGAKPEYLLLRLSIDRDRTVTRLPSFHYVAKPASKCDCGHFTVELLDVDRRPLTCMPLSCACDGGRHCWPKEIRDTVAFSSRARWLVVWENDAKIYEEEIPDPPKVEIVSTKLQDDGLRLEWRAANADADLWYLVHWHDERADEWRGVAPRQRETTLIVPPAILKTGRELDLRVLATSGIATGVADVTVKQKGDGHPAGDPDDVTVLLLEDPATSKTFVLRAIALDAAGRQMPADWIQWFDSRGTHLARGATLDVRTLPKGRNVVRAVFDDPSAHTTATGWLIENGPGHAIVHHAIKEPRPPRAPHKHPHPAPRPRRDE